MRRKPPLQLCGQKRKNSGSSELDNQREKHRLAEGTGSLPQSKEHIVQATIYLVDFMHAIIFQVLCEKSEVPGQLPEKLQPQVRCMQLQQLVSILQRQNQTAEKQLQIARQEKQVLEERNRTLELQLKPYIPRCS